MKYCKKPIALLISMVFCSCLSSAHSIELRPEHHYNQNEKYFTEFQFPEENESANYYINYGATLDYDSNRYQSVGAINHSTATFHLNEGSIFKVNSRRQHRALGVSNATFNVNGGNLIINSYSTEDGIHLFEGGVLNLNDVESLKIYDTDFSGIFAKKGSVANINVKGLVDIRSTRRGLNIASNKFYLNADEIKITAKDDKNTEGAISFFSSQSNVTDLDRKVQVVANKLLEIRTEDAVGIFHHGKEKVEVKSLYGNIDVKTENESSIEFSGEGGWGNNYGEQSIISAENGKIELQSPYSCISMSREANLKLDAKDIVIVSDKDKGGNAVNTTYSALEISAKDSCQISSENGLAIISGYDSETSISSNNTIITGLVKAYSGAKINLYGGRTFLYSPKNGKVCLESNEKDSLVSIKDTVLSIDGDIKAENGGRIYIETSAGSFIRGNTKSENGGIIDLNFKDMTQWVFSENSVINDLSVKESSIEFDGADSKYITLTSNSLQSDAGTLKLRTSLKSENKPNASTDRLIINNKAQGKLIADIEMRGLADKLNSSYISEWLVSQGEGSNLSIYNSKGKNLFSGNGMVSVWALSFVPDDEELGEDTVNKYITNNHGDGAGKWYLIYADRDHDSIYYPEQPEEDKDPDKNPGSSPESHPETDKPSLPPIEDPDEIKQVLSLGVSSMQALSFAADLDDLRTRTGEVRHGLSDGAWVRTSYQKERIFGSSANTFKQDTQDLHLGLDHLLNIGERCDWLLGGALRYAKSDQKSLSQFTTSGELEQYSAKLYATYLHEGGSYADFVVHVGRYDQELAGIANNGYTKFSANYKTYGYGLSAEVGHQFSLYSKDSLNGNLFMEPQLQFSYFRSKGKDYTTSTGMRISQEDADYLTGRLGMVMGSTFNFGEMSKPRIWQIGFNGGVKYEFLGDQTVQFRGVEGISKLRQADDVGGVRFYYGLTSDWKMSDLIRAYVKLEREEGDHYTKDLDLSIGVRYQF